MSQPCAVKCGLRRMSVALSLLLVLYPAVVLAAVCPTGSLAYTLTVRSHSTVTLAPPNCRLTNVNILIYCEPQSTLIINQFTLLGGHITIVGPANLTTTGNLSDVAVIIRDSVIQATQGPAVGVLVGFGANISQGSDSASNSAFDNTFTPGFDAPLTPFVASNISLSAYNSVLTSVANTNAIALGFGLDPVAFGSITNFTNISITAVNATLSATTLGLNTAAAAAGFAWGYRYVLFAGLYFDGLTVHLSWSKVAAIAACTDSNANSSVIAAAAGIATTSLAGPLGLHRVVVSTVFSTVHASTMISGTCTASGAATAVGVSNVQLLGGAFTMSDTNISAVHSNIRSTVASTPNMTVGPHVSSSVGVASGYFTAVSHIRNVNIFAVLSNVTSNATYSHLVAEIADGWVAVQAASAVCGFSFALVDYFVTFESLALATLWSTASSVALLSSQAASTTATSTVSGIAMANARVGTQCTSCSFYSAANASSSAAIAGNPGRAASAVAALTVVGRSSAARPIENPTTEVLSSTFVVAGGTATSDASVVTTQGNLSDASARGAVASIVAPLTSVSSVETAVSYANATSCASATNLTDSSTAEGNNAIERVANVSHPLPAIPRCSAFGRATVTWRSWPPVLNKWLGPFTDTMSSTVTELGTPTASGTKTNVSHSKSISMTPQYIDTSVVPPGVLSVSAAAANQVVVATAATGATIISSPGAAMQASRALSIIALSQCKFDYDGTVDFPISLWPGFGIQIGTRGAFLRGGVVAALGTVAAVFVFGTVLALLISTVAKLEWIKAASFFRFPGIMTVPVAVTLDGLVTCAVATALHGEARFVDTVLAALALAYLLFFTTISIVDAYKMPPVASTFGDREGIERAHCLDTYLRGAQGWVPRRATSADDSVVCCGTDVTSKTLHKAFGSVYKKYTADRRWFYIADTWLTIGVSAAKGTMPTTLEGCFIATGVTMALCGIIALLSVLSRPYVSPAKNSLLIASSMLTFVACVLVFAAMSLDSSSLLKAGQLLALLAGYLSVGNVAIALYGEFASRRGKKSRTTTTDEPMTPEREEPMALLQAARAATPPFPVTPLMLTMPSRPPRSEDGTASTRAPSESIPITPPPPGTRTAPPSDGTNSSEGSLRFTPQRPRNDTFYTVATPRVIVRTAEGQALFEELEDMLRNRSRMASRNVSAMPSRAPSGDRLAEFGFVPLSDAPYTLL